MNYKFLFLKLTNYLVKNPPLTVNKKQLKFQYIQFNLITAFRTHFATPECVNTTYYVIVKNLKLKLKKKVYNDNNKDMYV